MNGRSLPAPDAPVGSATRPRHAADARQQRGRPGGHADRRGRRRRSGPARPTTAAAPTFERPAPRHGLHGRRNRLGRAAGLAAVHAAGVGRRPRRADRRPAAARRRAGAGAAAPTPATPAPAGSITLGTQSRMIVEQADEFVEVFVLADLVNTTDGPVSLPAPIVFTPPAGALGTAVLEGVTSAVLDGGRIVVKGPLAVRPDLGAVRLPAAERHRPRRHRAGLSGRRADEQRHRAAARARPASSVAGERQRRDTQLEGRDYVVVSTGAIRPATPLEVTVSGMPARPRWPVRLALALAGAHRARRARVRARPRRRRRHRARPARP